MLPMKKTLLLAAIFIYSPLLFSAVANATPPLKRADVFINGKYSQTIDFDKRLLDQKFMKSVQDRGQLKELLRRREISEVPFRITTSAGSFLLTAKTAVSKDGVAINMDDLPVPCEAQVFFYQTSEGRNNPAAVKIVVNKVAEGASVRWSSATGR
jgi:hypothetical protein